MSLFHAPLAFAEESPDFFEKQVRPVLAGHCYSCHGPDKQKSGLRLDHGSFVTQGGETGPVVSPGDPAASRLFTAVSYADVDLQMPPDGKLSDEEIAVLAQWITEGAKWPEEPVPGAQAKEAFDVAARRAKHWAWQPIQDPAPPAVQHTDWPLAPIDQFILARLEQDGLAPAPDADRRTLMRRLSFDLTGLPPTPEAVEAFVTDTRPDAYERVVDELLASPAFGERWGRHWLDVTRYAETYGHEQDYPVDYAWRYRDYVIRAFNADVPYDQMVREHVAGDLLAQPRTNPDTGENESVQATGFWYMHQATHAPVDVRTDQADRIDNQIDVFSKGFLGLTVSCARCHDHKFDAVSAKDYYALAGYLRSSRQQHAYLDPQGKIAEGIPSLERAKARVIAALQDAVAEVRLADAPLSTWMMAAADVKHGGVDVEGVAAKHNLDADRLGKWIKLLDDPAGGAPNQPFALWWQAVQEPERNREYFGGAQAAAALTPDTPYLPEGDVLFETFDSQTAFERWSTYGMAFGDAPTASGAAIDSRGHIQFTPPGVAHSGLLDTNLEGTLRSPDFIIEHDGLQFRAAGEGCEIRLIIEGYELREFNPLLFDNTFIAVKHGGEFQWLQMIGGIGKFKGRKAFIEIVDPGDGWIAVDEIRFSDAAPQPAPDKRLLNALFSKEAPASTQELAARYDAVLHDALVAAYENEAQPWQLAFINYVQREGLWTALEDDRSVARALDFKRDQAKELPRYDRALAITEGTPQDEYVMLRGSYKTPGDLVQRRFLEAVDGPNQPRVNQGSGRLDLAEDLLNADNPLTSRVMVNRIWHHLMGRGIVASVDNFGKLGTPPTHPELLDYLATRFRENGWSIKHAIKDVVMSRTYRMSSSPGDDAAEEKDPDNVLLHRMNRRRLEGEAVRDAMFAVAGTLDATAFGPSVPAYISPYVEGNRRPEKSGPEDGGKRRSIYMEVRRNYMAPMLQAFDMPTPDSTQGRRNVSNVPAQALILMNDPVVTQQAEAWARQVLAAAPDTEGRIRALYLEALSREPEADEIERVKAYIGRQAEMIGLDAVQAQNDERVWAALCHVMFTLKEFIFIG